MDKFEDVASKRKSAVWKHFTYKKSEEKAKCNLCLSILKASGSSTNSLINHMKVKHKIEVRSLSETSLSEPKPKIKKICDFFTKKNESVDEVLAKLVAVDGLTFNQIANSRRIIQAFRADGILLPSSPGQIKVLFMNHFEKVKGDIIQKVVESKKSNDRFSISMDESTSTRNRRFINLNLHFSSGFQSLGLIRVFGSTNAGKMINLVKEKLSEYKVSLDNDVVASITDAASIMIKFGSDTNPHHVACLAHAIHLVVCDVLYKSQENNIREGNKEYEENEEFDVEDEENDVSNADEESTEEKSSKLIPELQNIIIKVRKIVKLFRRSPVCNDENLQPQNTKTFGKEKNLLLDCKTRWNSLLKMLQRFYEMRKGIQVAMIQIECQFDLSDQELDKIKDLCDALAPLEIATQYLCQEDADLILADKILAFTLNKLKDINTPIGNSLFQRFKIRIQERRNPEMAHLIRFLKYPDFMENSYDEFDIKIQKTKVTSLAINLIKRLFNVNDPERDEGFDVEVAANDGNREKTISKTGIPLYEEIKMFLKEPDHQQKHCECESVSHIIKKEIQLYQATKKRPENLENLYRALTTIRPTSVEAERAFSVMGLFANKLRNRLNDDTLSAMMVLKNFYKK